MPLTQQEIEKLFENAPEGCVGALVGKKGNVHYPKVTFASSMERKGCGFSGTACEGYGLSALECSWDWVDRPSSPAWNGEGLPPVGLACEYNASCKRDSGKELWCEVIIKYQSEWVVVFECTKAPAGHEASVGVELFDYVSKGLENRFRPIRTPEQIAAEEREAAIQAMYGLSRTSSIADVLHAQQQLCADLYDAGYRKVEQPK